MCRTGMVQSKVPSPPFHCLSPPPGSIHHSLPQWGVGNGSTFVRSANQSDSRCLSLGTFMACHKAGLWGITAPSNPAKWAIFPISGAAVRRARAINSRVNLWPWLLGQPSAVTTPLGPGGSHLAAKAKQLVRWNNELASPVNVLDHRLSLVSWNLYFGRKSHWGSNKPSHRISWKWCTKVVSSIREQYL